MSGSGNDDVTPMHNAPAPVQRKRWTGKPPAKDDFGDPIENSFIDGKTNGGPWALMTPRSHEEHGVGLGLGQGQLYVREEDGIYYKAAG